MAPRSIHKGEAFSLLPPNILHSGFQELQPHNGPGGAESRPISPVFPSEGQGLPSPMSLRLHGQAPALMPRWWHWPQPRGATSTVPWVTALPAPYRPLQLLLSSASWKELLQ